MMQSAHPQMLQAVRNDGDDDEALAAATSDCHKLGNQINAVVAARRRGALAVLLLFIAFGLLNV